MKQVLIIISTVLFFTLKVNAQQTNLIHFCIIVSDSITASDSVKVTILLKLTNKTNTNQVFVKLGNNKDKEDVDSLSFTINNDGDNYYANNNNLGNIPIQGRMLIFSKTYHKDLASQIKWGTAYLIRNDNSQSVKQYFRNFLPQ